MSIRKNLEAALAGADIQRPVYAAYDWFVEHRPLDWEYLFSKGLGQINHANLVRFERPHVQVTQIDEERDGRVRTEIRWVTDVGELREVFVDGWRQEYLIKGPSDYRTMIRALSDTRVAPDPSAFNESEKTLGDRGITIGQLGAIPAESRTPMQRIQIDFTGLERFSFDLSDAVPELFELDELMTEELLDAIRCAVQCNAPRIKLWENLDIASLGPSFYRNHLVPVYEKVLTLASEAAKKIDVHYDGKLNLIADDVARLSFGGLDSLTGPPEGDVPIEEARRRWPEKFLWIHPNLGWFDFPESELLQRIESTTKDARARRFCFLLSEEIPTNPLQTIPAILSTLNKR